MAPLAPPVPTPMSSYMLLKRITVHDPPTTITGVADFRQTCMHMSLGYRYTGGA